MAAWSKLLNFLVEQGQNIYENYSEIWVTLTTPIKDLPLGQSAVITAIFGVYPTLSGMAIVDFLMGAALSLFITLTVVRWVIHLVVR